MSSLYNNAEAFRNYILTVDSPGRLSKKEVICNISRSPYLNIEFLSKLVERYGRECFDATQSWYILMRNDAITFVDILRHPEYGWELEWVCKHKPLSLFAVQQSGVSLYKICWRSLSCNTSVTLLNVATNPYKDWNWGTLCQRFGFRSVYEIIKRNSVPTTVHKFDWKALSSSVTVHDVAIVKEDYREKWCWHTLTKVFDIKYITEHFYRDWNWNTITPLVPIEFIVSHKELDWNMNWLSQCGRINLSVIKSLSCTGKINWNYLSHNATLEFIVVENFPDKAWDWCHLLKRSYETDAQLSAVRSIQFYWRRAFYDPAFKICRARLMREWGELREEL